MERVEKATLVFFGGTGDLSTRKLFPAVYNLWKEGAIRDCLIVGVGRRIEDTAAYRNLLADRVSVASSEPEDWQRFSESIEFHHGEIQTEEDFVVLKKRLENFERARGLPGNRLFYYAVGPQWFGPVTARLSAAGLLRKASPEETDGWTRLIVEKPFGQDLSSAIALDRELHTHADESQIYRIDHYLGKETVQNVIAFRFANGLIEPTWNQKYVDHVQITVAESVGVEDRAGYYENAGALRDMMQNHMLQLLALTAMEPPIALDAQSIRDEKVKVLRAIRLAETPEEVQSATVRGQYGRGEINGARVPGYREEPGVAPDSTTPTYVAAKVFIDTWRWAGVPFLLRHGKRLPRRATEIAIQFRTPPLALFRGTTVSGNCTNVLMIRVQPDEAIRLRFGAKVPGSGMRIENVQMGFSYGDSFETRIPDAYERLLLDALAGDATLFTRSDEIRAMWRWADSLLEAWDLIGPPEYPNYAAGTWGPTRAQALFPSGDSVPEGSCPLGWRQL